VGGAGEQAVRSRGFQWWNFSVAPRHHLAEKSREFSGLGRELEIAGGQCFRRALYSAIREFACGSEP